MLWLEWFAAFLEAAGEFMPLSGQAQAIAHGWLDAVERRIFIIIVTRGARRLRPVAAHFYGPGRRPEAVLRALMGARLRRRLRAKDICARAAALTQDIEVLVALYARRLRRGLTRLSGTRTRRQAVPTLVAALWTVAAFDVDTS